MRIVETLLAKNEADILDAHLAFHVNAGVDVVIVTDHASTDGTSEILGRYAREGHCHVLREEGPEFPEADWITRMARLAASEYGADWVVNATPDEFWWPRGSDLKEVLDAVPARYGIVQAFVRNFIPRQDDGSFFADRMTVRLTAQAPINDPASFYRPLPKVAHRGDASITVSRGSHSVSDAPLPPLRGWYPIEVLHFPLRSEEQAARKAANMAAAFPSPSDVGTAYHARARVAAEHGQIADYYGSLCVDDATANRGIEEGALAVDVRLRDALRSLREPPGAFALGRPIPFPVPSVVDDAQYAVDAAVLGEADVVRAQRRLDELERRIVDLERSPFQRAARGLRRLRRGSSQP